MATLTVTDSTKLSELFRLCKEVSVPETPLEPEFDKNIDTHAAELDQVLYCLSMVRACKAELVSAKAETLALLTEYPEQPGSPEAGSNAVSAFRRGIQTLLDATEMPLEEKALSCWVLITSSDLARYTVDEQRAILCEEPSELVPLLKRAYEIWDTFVFKELCILSELGSTQGVPDEMVLKRFIESPLVQLLEHTENRWLSWNLLASSFESMLQLYAFGIKLASRLSSEGHFRQAFQVFRLLRLDDHADLVCLPVDKFKRFAVPAESNARKMVEEQCRSHFHGLLKVYLQSLSGALVLLRLQTSRKMKVEAPSECMDELERLAKETAIALEVSEKNLSDAIWTSYAKGFETVTLKSAAEIQVQLTSSRKAGSGDSDPTQQLALNTQKALMVFQQYCPEAAEALGILTALSQKLGRMHKV